MRSLSQHPRVALMIHPDRSAMSGAEPSVPVHMSTRDEMSELANARAQEIANILTHVLRYAQKADPRRTGMAARDSAEARPSMKAIASSLYLPPVSRATTTR